VHVEVSGLEPAREYWYRFRAGAEISQTGRTKTAPAAGAGVDRLRFAVCGCSHYETGYFTAYRRIAEEAFDFVFHTGDYIYEGRGDGGRNEGRVEIYTLVDYRNRYGQYKSDPDLIAAHRSAPFIVSWDDHEVEDNYAGPHDSSGTPREIFLLRRAAAYQAYYENMPVRAASFPSGPHMRIYRRLQFGNLLDLSVLDTRQWRSDQACGDGSRTGCAEAEDPARTILGTDQEKWLFENLGKVSARWTVLGQQVPSFARDALKANPTARFSMDKWDGYVESRKRLYARLTETRAPNPVILSGDVHLHYGADLKTDFSDPRSGTVGVEFTNTSISSGGDGQDVAGNWEQIRSGNPHIRYHSARRGYLSCTATPSAMRADFKILDHVTTAGAPARVGGALVVEAGRAGLNTA
jgi:alkaline phosphatase D